jgi:putative PIG3 family NAD(P)H quinone oxidoreductase
VRAIVITRPGGPDVLELQDRPGPAPLRGEVRVRVRAAGVNRADLLQRAGNYPVPADAPADIPGLEYAGEVDALGDGVVDLRVGDRVFGLAPGGTYAEHVVVPVRAAAKVPERLSFVEAAAVPEAFITAWDAMVTQARLTAGETVLIHAVGSGVGTAALQIAKAIGATAVGTSRSASKLDSARALGLTHGAVVGDAGEFSPHVLRMVSGGVDVVLELVGGRYVAEDLRCMAPRGRLVLVGLLAGAQVDLDLGAVLRKRLELRGTVLRARPLEERIATMQTFARHVVPLVASGALRPIVDRTFSLADARGAHAYMAGNEGFGKVILDIG